MKSKIVLLLSVILVLVFAMPAIAQDKVDSHSAKSRIEGKVRTANPTATALSGEQTYEVECGDHQCLMRGTPGWRLACGNTCFIAQWRLRTYRWISGIGWQLSTSQSVTINKGSAYVLRTSGTINRFDYYGSKPNDYDVTWESNGLGMTSGETWWSGIRRASWRDWRGVAHYWPCQACADMTDKNSFPGP